MSRDAVKTRAENRVQYHTALTKILLPADLGSNFEFLGGTRSLIRMLSTSQYEGGVF